MRQTEKRKENEAGRPSERRAARILSGYIAGGASRRDETVFPLQNDYGPSATGRPFLISYVQAADWLASPRLNQHSLEKHLQFSSHITGRRKFRRPAAYLSFIFGYSRCFTTALYAGRIIFPLFAISSIRCALQPAMRAMANSGVYSSGGMFSILYTKPE